MEDKNSYMIIPGAIMVGALIISGAQPYGNVKAIINSAL